MSTTGPTVSAAEIPPPLSEPQRLAYAFIAPSKTFADLNRKPTWWAPWLITAIFFLALAYTLEHKVGFSQIAENAMKASPKSAEQFERLSPADQETRRQATAVGFKVYLYSFPVLVLIYGVVIAGVLLLTLNFGLSAEIPFKTTLAIVFYAFLPMAVLSTSIVIASMLAPGFVAESFNLENPAATNLAALMDHSTASRPLYTLATGIDIFNIWTIILLGIGLSTVTQVKRSTAIWLVAFWLVVVKLIQAATAAIT